MAPGRAFPPHQFCGNQLTSPAGKVVKVYNGRGDVENRIKEGKNTLRWDKTSCQRFDANQARLKMGVLAYNLLHMIQQFYVWGEEVKRSIDWLIKRLIKVGPRFLITLGDGMSIPPGFSPGSTLPCGDSLGHFSKALSF
jgi:hypothetical protein